MAIQRTNTEPGRSKRRRRPGAVHAGLALLLAGGLAAALAAAPPAQRPAESRPRVAPAAKPWKKLSEREARYLQEALQQIRRMKGNFDWIGRQPLASGALAAAALAAEGGPEAASLREESARWAEAVVKSCEKWHANECARSQLPLQRLVLQYPETLPRPLLDRVRKAVSSAAPPPNENLVRDPWSFKDTENQRMISMARSLVAQTVAGTPNSPAARGWGAFAEAFLQAHDRDGWYEAESPGYFALSVTSLLQLADHAPQESVRQLAGRQLNLIFARWAQAQVGGYPAGPKSRSYSFWALSRKGNPWQAWAWLAAGVGKPEDISFMDRVELPVSRYEMPEPVVRLLTERRKQPPYEIKERRSIEPAKRRDLNTSLYSWATPDYILGVSQTVDGLALRVSGGQEVVATLYAEHPDFAPLYLWSRTRDPRKEEGVDWNTLDQAVGHRNIVVARMGLGNEGPGHAYLAPTWSKPEVMGDVVVSRCGDTYVALVTQGGWEVAPASEKFPGYYSGNKQTLKALAGSWVALPRRQPASVALEVGRKAEHGDFAAWKKVAAKARLDVTESGEIRYTSGGGARLDYVPGRRALMAGKAITPEKYQRLEAP
ncbi:MAG TPA: hypothetical protein VLE27_08960, partial [Thermoanaerobaculia bacterium]|nr:hypothetical protein [Thermoanaerobaculia bacterium]